QNGRIEGTVKGKGADGKVVPVEGATVDIIRTDIKGNWTVKTNAKGDFVNLGIPFSGTYTLIFSAPGWAPNYMADVKPERPPRVEIELTPGDGRRITYDELTAALKARNTASAKDDAEAKKRADESRKANENFDAMKNTFEEGFEF